MLKCTCVSQGVSLLVCNVSVSENFAYILIDWSLKTTQKIVIKVLPQNET